MFSPFDQPVEAPPIVIHARWHQWKDDFQLRSHEGRLFFRPSSKPGTLLVVVPLLPAGLEREDWPAFWREALERDQVARFVTYSYSDFGFGNLEVAALWENERVSLRQWWQDDWTPAPAPKRSSSDPVWHPRWEQNRPKAWPNHLLDAPLLDSVQKATAIRWHKGDEDTWRLVVHARLVSLGNVTAPRTVLFYPDVLLSSTSRGDSYALLRGEGWPEMMRREFVASGLVWHRLTEFPAEMRRGWRLETPAFSQSLLPTDFISAHEQLEATLFLRHWLREQGGLSDESIAKLLS